MVELYLAELKLMLRKNRPTSIDHWINKGYSIEDANKKISEYQSKSSLKVKNRFISNTANLLALGYSEWEIKKMKSPPNTIFHWINKGYSIEDANKKVSEFQTKQSIKFKDKRALHPELYRDYNSVQLGYWLSKGYTLEEAHKLLNQRQTTFSLEKCIEKYGEGEGLKIFNERQVKWKKSLQENFEREGDSRSPSSKFANSIIRELCLYLNIEIPKKEKWIKCKETEKAYSYDFTYKKKIIEFNGDYWHCNPLTFKSNDIRRNQTAEEIWQYDSVKNRLAESHGYEVLVIWESEWNKDSKQCIERCIKFLNKK
jgi:hypothetical protein